MIYMVATTRRARSLRFSRYGETNLVQQPGYGGGRLDEARAGDLIRAALPRARARCISSWGAHRRTRSCSTA